MKGVLKQCSLLSSLRNIAPRWCMPEHFSEAGASWRTKRCKGAGLSLWLDFKSERRPSFPLLLQQQHFQANFQVLEAEGGAEGEAEGEAEDLLVQALQLLLPVPLQNLLLRAGAEPGAGARAVADNVSLTF